MLLIYYDDNDDVMTWKCLLYYWVFVRGIHWWLVDSTHLGPVMLTYGYFYTPTQQSWRGVYWFVLIVSLNKLLQTVE